jgi:hypothetical protein
MFRFTIRDVLWLTVVVALAVGWWREWDERGRVGHMQWQWQEMYRAGMMTKGVEHVRVNYLEGHDAVYDENNGPIFNVDPSSK